MKVSSTKEKILNSARLLFNEMGYSHVTIRMIASELKMSSGNLNYHFKTREDLLVALYFEMVEEFDRRIEQLGHDEITLQTVRRDITSSMSRMIEYRFFWTDLYNLLRLNNEIKKHFEDVHQHRYAGYEYLFTYLKAAGIMHDFELSLERRFLIERMIGFSDTWLYNSFIYSVKIDDVYINQQATNLLFMLYPYLTEEGKNQFKKIAI